MRMDKKSNKTIFWGLVVIAAMAVLSLGAEGIADATGQTLLMTVLKKGTVYALLVVSMNLLNGFTGLFSLGQAGFMLIGAYTYAILTIPVAKRAGVYQYYDGGIVQFSIPEAFSGLLGDLVGGVIGMVVTLLICGLLAALFGWLIGRPVLGLRLLPPWASRRSSAPLSSMRVLPPSPTAPIRCGSTPPSSISTPM